jgi:hypothetical protein
MRKAKWRACRATVASGTAMDAFTMGPPHRLLGGRFMKLFKSKDGISMTERELAKVAEQRAALADRLNAACRREQGGSAPT